jgi:hypothetical protein
VSVVGSAVAGLLGLLVGMHSAASVHISVRSRLSSRPDCAFRISCVSEPMAIMLQGTVKEAMNNFLHGIITGDDGLDFIVVEREAMMNCDHLSQGERVEYEANYNHTRNAVVCSICRTMKHSRPPFPQANAEPELEPEP